MLHKQMKTENNERKPRALRLLAMLLCVVSVFAMVPTSAFAAISIKNVTELNMDNYSEEQVKGWYDIVNAVKEDKQQVEVANYIFQYVKVRDAFVPMNGNDPYSAYQAMSTEDAKTLVWYRPQGSNVGAFCELREGSKTVPDGEGTKNVQIYEINFDGSWRELCEVSEAAKNSTYVLWKEMNDYVKASLADSWTGTSAPFAEPIERGELLKELYIPEKPTVTDPAQMSDEQLQSLVNTLNSAVDGDIVDFMQQRYMYVGAARGFILMKTDGSAPANESDYLIVSDGNTYLYNPSGRVNASGYADIYEKGTQEYTDAAGADQNIFKSNMVYLHKRDINNILFWDEIPATDSSVKAYADWRINGTCANVVDLWAKLTEALSGTGKTFTKNPSISPISKGTWTGWRFDAPPEIKVEEKSFPDQQYLLPDSNGVAVSNTYLLSISTGIESGENVMYFTVRYEDTGGSIRTEYIFPHEGDLGKSYRIAMGNPNKEVEDEKAPRFTAAYHAVKDGTGYAFTLPSDVEGLRAYSTDEYLFSPSYPFKQLMGVDVFMRYPYWGEYVPPKGTPAVAQGWTCTDMRIFEVNKLYGVEMYGYCSDKYYIDFSGTLLAEMDNSSGAVDFELGKSDKIFHVPNVAYYRANGGSSAPTVFADEEMTVYDVSDASVKKANAYTTHELQFVFRFDFADKSLGGIEALACEVKDGKTSLYGLGLFEPLSLVVRYYDVFGVERRVNLPVVISTVACAMATHDTLNTARVIGVAQQGDTLAFAGNLPGFASMKEYKLYYGNDVIEMTSSQKSAYDKDKSDYEKNSNDPNVVAWRKMDTESATAINRTLDTVKQYYRINMPVRAGDNRSARIEERRKQLDLCKAAREDIKIIGASLYRFDKEGLVTLSYGSNNSLDVTTTGTPMLYYASNTVDGLPLYNRCTMDFGTMMKQPKGNFSLLPKDATEHYVVVVKTDDIATASTASKVKINLAYTTTSGLNAETGDLDTSGLALDFYGYWPGVKTGSNEAYNMAYDKGTNAGGTMEFYVEIPDLDQFKSITFSMDGNSSDDWQMESLAIYQCRDMSRRLAKWEDCSGKSGTSNRVFYRSYDTTHCLVLINSESSKVYLNGNNPVHMDFSNAVPVQMEDVNWNEIRDTMTFEQAQRPLGFTRARYRYQVDVKVKGNKDATDADGDTGSNNLFYFQLIFESGNSAYVLANQQLVADGFRAGQTESFFVSTNQNYGDLLEVRIIPDDSVNEEKDIFDKLCIDYIEVIKVTDSGLCRTWHVSDVGWIDIDYRDANRDGQEGRTEGELARIFAVTYPTYSLNLMFAIETGTYEDNGIQYDQFHGSVTAEIVYKTIDGKTGRRSFDVVSAMYMYSERKAIETDIDFVDSEGEKFKKAESDNSTMFRAGHIDRFEYKLSDATEILRLTLTASGNATHWWIKDVSIYQITETGEVRINVVDEYQKTNAQSAIYVSSSTSENGYMLVTDANGVPAEQNIEFTLNPIDVYEGEDVWISAVKRLPEADTDTLNLFVYMTQSDDPLLNADPVSKYQMVASITYQRKMYDATCQITTEPLSHPLPTSGGNQQMFYVSGIKATGMSALYSLRLKASDNVAHARAYVDYAVIQRIRSGVVVETYYFDYGNMNADLGLTATPGDRSKYQKLEQQVVSLQMSEDTPKTTLFAESVDMAVAIEYIGSNDQIATSHFSPYIYLTDQDITEVKPGQIISLTFNEPYVREIVGIKLVPVGNLTGTVTSACAVRYEVAKGSEKGPDGQTIETQLRDLKGWDNFADSLQLQRTQLKMRYTDVNVAQVEMQFETGSNLASVNSGTDGPIRMTLTYRDQHNITTQTRTYSDIRPYLTKGGFQTGETATITMLIPDLSRVRAVELEPYNGTDNMATWSLVNVTCRSTVNGEANQVSRGVNTVIYQGEPLSINLSNVTVYLTATVPNPDSVVITEGHIENGNLDMTLLLNENDFKADNRYLTRGIQLATEVKGALNSNSRELYRLQVELLKDGTYTLLENEKLDLSADDNGVVTFLPGDDGSKNNVYRITVYSTENPAARSTVRLLVTRDKDAKLPETAVSIAATASCGDIGSVENVLKLAAPEADEFGKVTVTVRPTVTNSLVGYDYTVTEGDTELINDGDVRESFDLQLPADSEEHLYVITVISREDRTKTASVAVHMGAVAAASAEETQSETTEEGNEGATE